MRKILPVIFLLGFAAFSCKKDNETTSAPVVQFISPAQGAQVNVTDTICIQLHLADESGLVYVDVKLTDQQLGPVASTVRANLSGTSMDVTIYYIIDNHRLPSGAYYLVAEAHNGANFTRQYLSINITGIPRATKGFFAATLPASGTVDVYKCDTSWSASAFGYFSSDFTDMAVSSYWQQLYIDGYSFGLLRALNLDTTSSSWSVSPVITNGASWGPMSVYGSRLWVAQPGYSAFHSYDEAGAVKYTGTGDNGYAPLHLLQSGDRIFSEQKDVASSNVKMVVYSSAGGRLQETNAGLNVVDMFAKSDNEVFVVGNSGAQGKLLIYDYASNGFWEPITLPAGRVTSATQVDSTTLLIAMDNSNIYKFTYSPVGLLTWKSGVNAQQVRYNDVDNSVLSAEGVNVNVYDYSGAAMQHTVSLPDSAKDVEWWFNR
ncbi:MAG TPA: Ig-like domain-containing protein [Bacteroidia bacterium]|nr:Ig-like domain-containing protein [Bacteroidia bacterium]